MIKLLRKKRIQLFLELNMTAMCVVVFQLLIYLILTAKPLIVTTTLDVNRPAAQDISPSGEPIPMVEIMVFQKEYVICGKRVNIDGLDKVLHQLAKADHNQTVTIKCTPDSPHERLIETLNLCNKVNMRNISVMSM
jgi:biopolymer transport protein ExbD